MRIGFLGAGNSDMGPRLVVLNIMNSKITNIGNLGHLRWFNTIREQGLDLPNLLVAIFGHWVFLTHVGGRRGYSSSIKTAFNVFTSGDVPKIVNRIIQSVSVNMIDLVSVWLRAYECLRDELVDHWSYKFTPAATRKPDSEVSFVSYMGFKEPPRSRPWSWFITSDPSEARYRVCWGAINALPYFHERSIT